MTKKHSTKRTLIASLLVLTLCFSALIGTTFAWFTDSVSSGSNVIKTGNLDIEVEYTLDGESWDDLDGASDLFQKGLWEPGHTEVVALKVTNAGSLALKYSANMNIVSETIGKTEAGEDIKLSNVLEVSTLVQAEGAIGDIAVALAFNGENKVAYETTAAFKDANVLRNDVELAAGDAHYVIVKVDMPEAVGNEANHDGENKPEIEFGINFFATQFTKEEDSFGTQYDAEAEYAAETMLNKVAAVAAGESATVVLDSNGFVSVSDENPVGAKVVGDVTLDLNGKTLFVKIEDGNAHKALFNITKGGKLTVTGEGTISMVTGANNLVSAIFNNTAGTLVIENGTYTMENPDNWQEALIPTIIDNNSTPGASSVIINGGSFYHTRNMFRNFASNSGVASIVINGGSFSAEFKDWGAIWNQKPSAAVNEGQGVIEINGGEFNYIEISNEFETGVTVADGVVIAKKVDSADDMTAALKNGGVYEVVCDIEMATDAKLAVPAGVTTTVNMNGYTLYGTSTETGKNFDFIDVKGTLTMNGGAVAYKHEGANMGWSYSTNNFNVTAGGVLNLNEMTVENLGGSDMGFCVHLNNWGEVTLNVNDSTLTSNYVAVRVFNSGYDKNNVTIKNSTLNGGSNAFWVHNYTAADFGTQDKADSQATLLNFDIFNGTNTFVGNPTKAGPIRYGFTNSIQLKADGTQA